jgi:hypothetical protein
MNKFEAYDISDNTWTTLAPMPSTYGRADATTCAATAIGGKIYVAGGATTRAASAARAPHSLDIFESRQRHPRPLDHRHVDARPRGGVNGVAANGCFFVWAARPGHRRAQRRLPRSRRLYNPRTNTWTSLLPLPTPIHGSPAPLRRRPDSSCPAAHCLRRLERQQHLPGLPPRHELRVDGRDRRAALPITDRDSLLAAVRAGWRPKY